MSKTQVVNQKVSAMPVRTGVKAGAITSNHNQALVVRTGVKAGALTNNHNQVAVNS